MLKSTLAHLDCDHVVDNLRHGESFTFVLSLADAAGLNFRYLRHLPVLILLLRLPFNLLLFPLFNRWIIT